MRSPVVLVAVVLLFVACNCCAPSAPAIAGAIGFDNGDTSGWRVASTGGSGPHASWEVRADAAAVSAGRVLSLTAAQHDADDRFNLFLADSPKLQDGRIGVYTRADGGEVDQGGGPMWRVQDADNYYLCRYNPLESNFRVYVVKDGVRRQLATALVEAGAGWHRLEAEHVGDRITCWLDGTKYLEATDATITQRGGVGLWTKADARTSFDDLLVQPRN